jgi:hypothetical protein
MVEVFTAIQSGIELVLVNVEEPIDFQAAWPLKKTLASYPFTGGKVKWKAAEFACNRKVVVDKLGGQNSYPRPTIFPGMDANHASGNVTRECARKGGHSVVSWIVKQIGGSLPDVPSAPQISLSQKRLDLDTQAAIGSADHKSDAVYEKKAQLKLQDTFKEVGPV